MTNYDPTTLFDNFTTHVIYFISGSTFIGLLGHAVNTFPMPKSDIGRWFLGVIQYAVGQRIQSQNTMNGHESVMVPKPVLQQARDIIANAPIVSEKIVPVAPIIPITPADPIHKDGMV
ncbi:MAG TPA: hypothetical protein VNZ86_06660 [Bacteroidia bacterium]|jgi:hypothetical protein|nr:hypothetical protein [Bacteroidia bacterium]